MAEVEWRGVVGAFRFIEVAVLFAAGPSMVARGMASDLGRVAPKIRAE